MTVLLFGFLEFVSFCSLFILQVQIIPLYFKHPYFKLTFIFFHYC